MNGTSKIVVVGTVGHINHGKRALIASLLIRACHEVVVYDPAELKNKFVEVVPAPNFPEPVFCHDLYRKSKGDKRRDRAERKRKGWR